MGPCPKQVRPEGFDKDVENSPAVPELCDVALCLGELPPERGTEIPGREKPLSEFEGPCGVGHDLERFYAGKFVEEPAAACVHEHEVPLHLQQGNRPAKLFTGEGPSRLSLEEFPDFAAVSSGQDGNIPVPGTVRVGKDGCPFFTKKRGKGIPKAIQGFPEGLSPALAPARPGMGGAAAVAPPPLNAVGAAP